MKNEAYDLRALIRRAQGALKDGFTLKISDASAGENLQVEIRDADGGLCWRMWSFEPDFDLYLKNEIERVTDCAKLVENKSEGNEKMGFRITITECYGERRTTVITSRKCDLDAAIRSAIRKGYGVGIFIRDHGISVGPDALAGSQYGQIGRSTGHGYNMKTGRVCIRAKEV